MARAALTHDDITAFRRRAVDAAMHLFADQGYAAVTMRALASALSVSAMTSYRYFEGKEALFALVRTEAFRRFGDRLEASLRGKGDALARLARLKRAYLGFAVEQLDAYRLMFELRQPDEAQHPELLVESRRAFLALRRTVAEGVAAGQLAGDPLTIAHLLWAGAHGLASLHLAGKLTAGRGLRQLAAVDHELVPFLTRKRRTR